RYRCHWISVRMCRMAVCLSCPVGILFSSTRGDCIVTQFKQCCFVACALLLTLPARTSFGQTYYDLGVLSGTSTSNSYAISDAGHIAGSTTVSGGATHAFLYTDHMIDLGTLTGFNESEAYGINEADDYAGYSMNESDEEYPIADMVDLGNLGGYFSRA